MGTTISFIHRAGSLHGNTDGLSSDIYSENIKRRRREEFCELQCLTLLFKLKSYIFQTYAVIILFFHHGSMHVVIIRLTQTCVYS